MIKKKYLTFEDLMGRWNCEKRDIHYLIANDDLVPSIVWNNPAILCVWEEVAPERDGLCLVQYKDENDCPDISHLNGWLYLRRPTELGPYGKYKFSYATIDAYPKIEEFYIGWYRLLESNGHGDKTYASVNAEQIEAVAVFMMDMVDWCELIHPSLLKEKTLTTESTTEPDPTPPGRREHQIETILAIIAALEYDSLQIPDGGKSKIKTACLTRAKLFTDSSFDHAWKQAVSDGLVRMKNHDNFTQK